MQLREGTPEEAGLSSERLELVKERCAEWVDDGTHPALVVLVARHGVIALHEAYGVLRPDEDTPVERDSIFPLASIVKTITATALLTLVEDGLVGLTRPVQEYIPEFVGEHKQLVCVHHLLTYTAGFGTDETFTVRLFEALAHGDPPECDPTQHPRVEQYLRAGYEYPLERPPGEVSHYNTYHLDLAGEIVRRVSGTSFDDFVRARIFGPLGMTDSYCVVPDHLAPRVVRRSPDGLAGITPILGTRWHRTTPLPSMCGFATARDLAVFAQTMLNGGAHDGARILSRHMVREMTRDQVPGVRAYYRNEDHAASVGYGWLVAADERWTGWPVLPRGSFSMSGAGGVNYWVDPSNDVVGVFFSVEAVDDVWRGDLFAAAVTASVVD